jgi:signal peptidase II
MRFVTRRWLAAGIVLLIALDWLTKLWVLNRVALGETLAVLEGWLYLSHRRNTGVAFSMLSDLPEPWGPVILVALSLCAVGIFLKLLGSTPDPLSRAAIGLITAGALGNVGDRIVNGSVTDFIFVAFFPYVFNVADAAITVGGIVLALRLLMGANDSGPVPAPADT